jgi:hypothetical protein
VCSGRTGHTEAVQLAYRPSEVSYEQLCDAFFKKINPKQVRLEPRPTVSSNCFQGAAFLSSPHLAMKLPLLSAACPSPDSACFTAGAACLLLQRNGQGNDHGSQYRTGIYWHNEDQRQVSYLLTMKVTATVATHTMCGQPGLLLPSQLV